MTPLEYRELYESEDFRNTMEPFDVELGARYSKDKTSFLVWVINADKVSVRLYRMEKDLQLVCYQELPLEAQGRGLYGCEIKGNLHGIYYSYVVEREGKVEECIDPYARACSVNGVYGMILNLEKTDPRGWKKDSTWSTKNANTVITELHIKDFSYQEESGVREAYRGKYLAFTEKRTSYEGEPTCLSYLKKMGVSHVHILPSFDYASVEEAGSSEQFNWGYDPKNYNIPEGSYATDPHHGEVRVNEYKRMVRALHEAGIGVIMDVVYNHTYEMEGSFQTLAPYYYYRQWEDGSTSNGSCCGNDTCSERAMFRKFMIESVLYWAREYHMDGFRFDLMGLHDVDTMNAIREALDKVCPEKKVFVYGEPWAAGPTAMRKEVVGATKDNIHRLHEGISIFSDDTRDAIKGSVFYGEKPGYVNGATKMEENIASAYRGWCDGGHGFAPKTPSQMIHYVSVHDNYTLWDKLTITAWKEQLPDMLEDLFKIELPDNLFQEILDENKLTAGIIMTCLGIPLFQCGEEFGRTKHGDENSYQSSPEINCLDWKRMVSFHELVEYYRGLIAFRGQITTYQDLSMDTVKKMKKLMASDGIVTMKLEAEGPWKELLFVCNARDKEYQVTLPDGQWQKLVDKNSSWLWKKSGIRSKMSISSGQDICLTKSITMYGRKDGI